MRQRELAEREGTFVCPEGGACFAALRHLRESGWLEGDEDVVVLNTGAGIKYPETVPLDVPLLANVPSAVFYPFNLAFVLTTRPQLLTADMLLHVWLAGAFFYLFARRAVGAPPAAPPPEDSAWPTAPPR